VRSGYKIALLIAMIVTVVTASLASSDIWLKHRIQTTDYCSNCHVIEPYYNSWKNSDYLANTHAQAGITCQDCHTQTTRGALKEIFKNVTHDFKEPLKDQSARPVDCLQCHGSYADLAEATKNLQGPDGFLLGRNPHNSHWGQIDCGICHKMHKPSVDFCSGCHGFPVQGQTWSKRPFGNGIYYTP